MRNFLSKSDFKVARSCATKLYYRKHQYPSKLEGSEYLELLAEGGFMIGCLAQLLYPDGREITNDNGTEFAIEETGKLLASNQNIILFEPAIEVAGKLVRIDILIKKGNTFELIEVKSKSFNSDEYKKKGEKYFNYKWADYLDDVAYQKMTLQEKFPESNITSYFMLPDKAFISPIDGMPHWFEIKRHEKSPSGFQGYDVLFTGDLSQLKHHPLKRVQIDSKIDPLIPEVKADSVSFLESISSDSKLNVSISIKCKGCEFKVDRGLADGFSECWGVMARANPNILELGQLGNINRIQKDGINELISNGKSSLYDVPEDYLRKEDGEPYYNSRPLLQLTEKDEFLLADFGNILEGTAEEYDLTYPLHFIDFETSQMALPYYKGMRAYDKVMFQWSCHTLHEPGGTISHQEWINTEDSFPNFEFARSLMKATGSKGSLMTWSPYENTQLNSILAHLIETNSEDEDLISWIKMSADIKDGNSSRLIDMNKLALKYYFHPRMGGRTSIKATLPAVLSATKSERVRVWLADEQLLEEDESGLLVDPYKLLPSFEIIDHAEAIKDGSGAMRAYQDMMYGVHKHDLQQREKYKKGLLNYCKLDTLAMVIIWEHWEYLATQQRP